MLVRTVSEMFALANGKKCTVPYSCYYCSAPPDEEQGENDQIPVGLDRLF